MKEPTEPTVPLKRHQEVLEQLTAERKRADLAESTSPKLLDELLSLRERERVAQRNLRLSTGLYEQAREAAKLENAMHIAALFRAEAAEAKLNQARAALAKLEREGPASAAQALSTALGDE